MLRGSGSREDPARPDARIRGRTLLGYPFESMQHHDATLREFCGVPVDTSCGVRGADLEIDRHQAGIVRFDAALVSPQPRQLSEGARLCLNDAVIHGTGHVELRTRIDGVVVEVVLVPTDGSEPLCLTRMVQQT